MNSKKSKKTSTSKNMRNQSGLNKNNYAIFGVALLVLLVGYWALAQPPVNGFLSLTLAPILLVFGYCVLVPLAILYNKRTP